MKNKKPLFKGGDLIFNYPIYGVFLKISRNLKLVFIFIDI
jgi:hypothetical protein